ncbi:MAG: hypothetical protein ACRD3B_04800 [Candidatus Sulfotelmatobacter sp.]
MSKEVRGKIARDGGFVIPTAFRKALGIEAGGEILLGWKDHELCITTHRLRIEHAKRKVRKYVKPGHSL